jgi:hypothetical protein
MSDAHVDAALASKPLARAVASAFGKPRLLAAAAAGFAVSPAAFAATYTVNNLNDSGSGSLRDAIAQANANAGADTITFASNVSGTITLTSGSLHIYDAVNIQGPGASVLTIAGSTQIPRPSAPSYYASQTSDIVIGYSGGGGGNKPAATLAATPVTISGVTITGGTSGKGGGIYANNALLTVNNCNITGNTAYYSGGGVYIAGYYSALTVNNSTISNNTAGRTGGGLATTDAAVTVQESAVTGNTAGRGGGIHVHNDNANALTVSASTVSGNTSTGNSYSYSNTGGGGVYTRHVSTSISNSTIANNDSTAGFGGGFGNYIDSSAVYSTTLSNSTVSGNGAPYAGGVSANSSGAITMTNSVVGGNTARYSDNDVGTHGGGTIAAAFSLIGDTGAATITDNGGNLLNVAPQLGVLANNGGPTQTMLPLAGSPLIDAGDPAFSGLATDQRGAGFPRIVNGRVDIGAVEFGTAAVAAEKIPAPGLGLGGQLGLGALLGLAGLAVARRRRTLGTAAGIVMAAALSLSSPAQAGQGHETRQRDAVTITSFSVNGKIATIVLGNGQTITAPKWQVRTLDRRSNATSRQVRKPSGVSSGTPAAVSYETDKQGQSHHVRIRLTDTLQQAQALVAKRP